ncbi:MAG: hypothetical protein LBS71_03235 [Puniceicoccales bacterium]|jgi:beta-N-acetylhexosaminidase|nr:hypothetical protein [Puniceicoccales bacterium]
MSYRNTSVFILTGFIFILMSFIFQVRVSASEEIVHLPFICGIHGTELTNEEIEFLKKYRPIGAILSSENLEYDTQRNINKEKFRKLCGDIHNYSPYILTDQEGGRVQHLQGSNCYRAPAPGSFSENIRQENFQEKCKAIQLNVKRIDQDLLDMGINVNCAPCCDLLPKGTASFIGNRSFGNDPQVVISFAVDWVKQAAQDGIISVLKHCPGHGNTVQDSHRELPVVNKSLPDLLQSDFKIFEDTVRQLQQSGIPEDCFWVMTAHVVYPAADPEHCATQSPTVIHMIREKFNFHGKIVSDCIRMQALKGELWERAIASLKAGCDYVLCCSSNLEQKISVAEKIREYMAAKNKGSSL